jgi:POT family proton-dependent oligopeptide transporter
MLIVLYMVNELFFNDYQAYGVYGRFVAFVYLMPVVGGMLADRVFKIPSLIFCGVGATALGCFVVGLPFGVFCFYLGLALLSLGYGLFKTNITRILGQMYSARDQRRESGFTIFFMASNAGAFLAAIVAGYIGYRFGWHYAFSLAGLIMTYNLFLLYKNRKELVRLSPPVFKPVKVSFQSSLYRQHLRNGATLFAFFFLSVIISIFLWQETWMKSVLMGLAAFIVFYIGLIVFKSTPKERSFIAVIFILLFFQMVFFSLFEQLGSSMMLFIERNIERFYWGSSIPTVWFQSINPAFIVLLGPMFSFLWLRLSLKGKDWSVPAKFSLGLLFLALGFAVISLAAFFIHCDGKVAPSWLVLAILFQSAGELILTPNAMSTVMKLAPQAYTGFFIGLYFLSVSFANYFAGEIARLMAVYKTDVFQQVHPLECIYIYAGGFGKIAIGAGIFAGIMILFLPYIKSVIKKI